MALLVKQGDNAVQNLKCLGLGALYFGRSSEGQTAAITRLYTSSVFKITVVSVACEK